MLSHKMGRLHVETCDDKYLINFRDDIRDYKRGRLRLIHAMHAFTSRSYLFFILVSLSSNLIYLKLFKKS